MTRRFKLAMYAPLCFLRRVSTRVVSIVSHYLSSCTAPNTHQLIITTSLSYLSNARRANHAVGWQLVLE